MKFLFTSSNMIGGRLIQWGTGEDVSHVAVTLGNSNAVVVHSVFGAGVETLTTAEFRRQYNVVYEVEFTPETSHTVEWVKEHLDPKPYDYLAIIWFGFKILLRKIFNRRFFVRDTWEQSSAFMCTELASLLAFGEADSVITPLGLRDKLIAKGGTLCQ